MDRIEASGHCPCRANSEDRRSSIIELTPSGRRLLAKATEVFEEELQARLGSALSDRVLQHGSLVLLFDVDEHTGGFGGAKRYFEGPDAPEDVAGVMIGYPGMDKLVVDGCGVHRVKLHVYGVASHSGGSTTTPSAIEKAAHLIRVLSTAELPLPGKLTVTAIEGGHGYSVTPDLCTFDVDIRTTPTFDDEAAARLLPHLVAEVDDAWPATRPTLVQLDTRWPAWASAPPRGSASATSACTPPTSVLAWTPLPRCKPSTTPRCSA